ncbi:MAG: hypothetical protein EXS63_07260 [Candidatus Omnitrophica bacterium]|nr:hypothetical protein [Candidatus Omnitrophota bacterium]
MSTALESTQQPIYSDATLGLSHEAKTILSDWFKIAPHYSEPASRQKGNINQEFYRLAAQWKEATQYLSSISQISMHPAYQHIIGMGPSVVPIILNELKQKPANWFWALKAITRTDPVPAQFRGNIEKMIEFWLKWGRDQGYVI